MKHDIAYRDFKDLTRRTAANKVWHYQAFNIAKLPKYNGYERGHSSMVYKIFDKKSSSGAVKNFIIRNDELIVELYNSIIRKFKKRKLHSSFILL